MSQVYLFLERRCNTDIARGSIDPTNYRIPHTAVTVSLEGKPPYGIPLPREPLILTLAAAQTAADKAIRREGEDTALPGLWRVEEGSIGIDVYTQLSVDCKFSTLETGLLGLVDIFNDPSGVGPVAADFNFMEDGLGEVASGRLRLLEPYSAAATSASTADVTLIEQGRTASLTLVGAAVETGFVAIA